MCRITQQGLRCGFEKTPDKGQFGFKHIRIKRHPPVFWLSTIFGRERLSIEYRTTFNWAQNNNVKTCIVLQLCLPFVLRLWFVHDFRGNFMVFVFVFIIAAFVLFIAPLVDPRVSVIALLIRFYQFWVFSFVGLGVAIGKITSLQRLKLKSSKRTTKRPC